MQKPWKKQNPMKAAILVLILSTLLGGITAKLSRSLWEVGIDSLNSRYFQIIQNMRIDYKDLFFHIFFDRVKNLFAIWLISITILGLFYIGYKIVTIGFQIGYLFVIFMLHYQWKGLLLFLAYYFPQCILYIPIMYVCLKSCFQLTMEVNYNNTLPNIHNFYILKKYVKVILLLLGAIAVSALVETFIGSFILRKAISCL